MSNDHSDRIDSIGTGCLVASTRIRRADNHADVPLGQLAVSGARDVPVWTLDRHCRLAVGLMATAFFSGVRPTFALGLASGRVLEATPNHPFFTLDGWLRVDELTLGERIACVPDDRVDTDVAWDTLVSIMPIGPQPVYDLSVPGAHNFLADGVIAHISTPAAPRVTRSDQWAAPGPGRRSTSPACIGSPQWAQRRSTRLISSHAWWW